MGGVEDFSQLESFVPTVSGLEGRLAVIAELVPGLRTWA